jgi:AcrR family transcriptional regulator
MAKSNNTINLADAMSDRDRRGKIVLALYRCMAKKGYAATTLCDIAEEAGMSSSHLLYYYPGKEAILEAFFKAVTDRIDKQVAELEGTDPAEQIEAIADLFLSSRGLRKVDQGVMLDLYGQAVQNRAMRRVKVAHDRRIQQMFLKLFERTPCAPDTTPQEAAQSAYAMLLGLRGNSFYDSQLTPAEANRLFRKTLLRLADIDASSSKRRTA